MSEHMHGTEHMSDAEFMDAMTPEAEPRTPSGQELQALLRKVPTHSGAEYRNWIALLKKAEAEAAQPATPVGALDPERLYTDSDAIGRAATWLHKNAATRRIITCGPDSRGCREAHRQDARDLLAAAYLAAASEPAGGGEG